MVNNFAAAGGSSRVQKHGQHKTPTASSWLQRYSPVAHHQLKQPTPCACGCISMLYSLVGCFYRCLRSDHRGSLNDFVYQAPGMVWYGMHDVHHIVGTMPISPNTPPPPAAVLLYTARRCNCHRQTQQYVPTTCRRRLPSSFCTTSTADRVLFYEVQQSVRTISAYHGLLCLHCCSLRQQPQQQQRDSHSHP